MENRLPLSPQWHADGADHDAVRRLTAAWIGRYGWLKSHQVAVAANDRGAGIKEPIGGGVS